MKDGLPTGWCDESLGELGTWVGGGTPSKAVRAFWTNGTVPWVSPKDMKRERLDSAEDLITERAVAESATRVVPKNSVLVVARSGILQRTLPVAINDVPVALNQDMKAVAPRGVLPAYLFFGLRAFEHEILHTCAKAGTTVANLELSRFYAYRMPIAPAPEQRRIVAKLEALQTRSRRAREALEAIPPLLERLRQSILAAAFRGDLTRDWREKHPDVEPASELLKRIRVERRKKWELAELAKMKAKGKSPKDDKWKAKYKEPKPVDVTGLPELPEGWCWGTWGDLSDWITYGFTRPMPHVVEGLPVVTAKHVKARTIDFQNAHRTTEAAFVALSAKDMPAAGDLLITKDGTLGRAAVVPDNVRFCINQSVAVVWLRGSPMHREYLLAMAEAPFTQNAILSAAQGMAIQHLSVTDFARFPVPLAPLAEQGVVAERVEACLGVVGKASVISEQLAESLDSFNQSVLGKAFRGELVPQDPSDEPAAVMLERVGAQSMTKGNGGESGRALRRASGNKKSKGRTAVRRRSARVTR